MSTASFFRDKSVLITGASAGIGAEMAVQLAAFGAKLTLAARRGDALESLAARIAGAGLAQPAIIECDVARDGDLEAAAAAAVQAWGKLDIAIANAGFGVRGTVRSLSIEDYRRQFETNIFGVLRTIYAALPEVRKTRGNLVIVGSVAGWIASPAGSAYAMSKFAVRALANSLATELRGSGVKVTLISPGFVVSDFHGVDNAGTFHPGTKDPIPAWIRMPTDRAVRQMLRAIAKGKREQIITFHGKLLVWIERHAPWVVRALSARVALRKES